MLFIGIIELYKYKHKNKEIELKKCVDIKNKKINNNI